MFGATGAGLQDGTRGPATATRDVPGPARRGRAGAGRRRPVRRSRPSGCGRWCTVSSSWSWTGSCRTAPSSGTSTSCVPRARASSAADPPGVGGPCHGGAMSVSRTQVLRYRVHAQQLDRPTRPDRGPDDAAILDLGVQDTGPDGALWALAVRGVPVRAKQWPHELALAWTVRVAPHAYRRRDLPAGREGAAPVLRGRRRQARHHRLGSAGRRPASPSSTRSRRRPGRCTRSSTSRW